MFWSRISLSSRPLTPSVLDDLLNPGFMLVPAAALENGLRPNPDNRPLAAIITFCRRRGIQYGEKARFNLSFILYS